RRRHTRFDCDWSSDVCSSDLVAALLNGLPPDDRTDFLEELSSNVVRELIKLLDPEERKITLSLLGYPENSIGRLMTPDYVYVYRSEERRVGKECRSWWSAVAS